MTFVTKLLAVVRKKNSIGALVYNEMGIITMSDPYIDHVFNLDEGESVGMQVRELIPSLGMEEMQSTERDSKETAQMPYTLKGITKQGDEVNLNLVFNRFNTGTQTHTLARLTEATNQTSVDIETIYNDLQLQTKKRRIIEEKFIKIQRTYDAMVHNFPDGVIGILNRQMKYVLIDGKELHTIDLPAMGLTDRAGHENQDLVSAAETRLHLIKAFEGQHVSFELATKDQVYNIIAVPLPDSKNNIPEILCVLRNVTERKRMEDGLRVALEKEKELGNLKSRFVTMASHEFRTPLTTILSSAYLLENYIGIDFDTEKQVHINRIKRGVDNLTMILDQFLLLEKYEQSEVALLPATVNVESLIKSIVVEMDFIKKENQIISFNFSGSPIVAGLDSKLLWTITTNLISNAIKYSSGTASIIINSEVNDSDLKITISDTGMGIPEDEQKHIFERFYRARNATNLEGTGLGLHIVQKWVRLLKGTITFTSKLDAGTTFFVSIPTKVANDN